MAEYNLEIFNPYVTAIDKVFPDPKEEVCEVIEAYSYEYEFTYHGTQEWRIFMQTRPEHRLDITCNEQTHQYVDEDARRVLGDMYYFREALRMERRNMRFIFRMGLENKMLDRIARIIESTRRQGFIDSLMPNGNILVESSRLGAWIYCDSDTEGDAAAAARQAGSSSD